MGANKRSAIRYPITFMQQPAGLPAVQERKICSQLIAVRAGETRQLR